MPLSLCSYYLLSLHIYVFLLVCLSVYMSLYMLCLSMLVWLLWISVCALIFLVGVLLSLIDPPFLATRLLRQWLMQPLQKAEDIVARQAS